MVAWILISILALIIILGIVAIYSIKKSKKKHTPDYYTFYIIGITWLPLGIVFMATDLALGPFFFILGLAYLAIGLANKDKWKKRPTTWKQYSKAQKTTMIISLVIGIILLVVAFVFFMLMKKGVI